MYDSQMHFCIVKIKEMSDELGRVPTAGDWNKKFPNIQIGVLFGSYDKFLSAAGLLTVPDEPRIPVAREPKILVLDIETKPIIAYCWGLFDQNISLDMIIEDWSIISWAAKWIGSDEVFYQDLSKNKDYTDDRKIVEGIFNLLNECDAILTQNGSRFDEKKLNAKFAEYGLGAPSPYRHIDALKIKKKKFGLTSNKLEYSTNKFNSKYKKLKHKNFPGMSLWIECLNGNQDAWKEMMEYNIHDVLALEELYTEHLIGWDNTINHSVYNLSKGCCPNCGSEDLIAKDYVYTKTGAYQSFRCKKCKAFSRSKSNELSSSVTKSMLKKD